MLVCTADRPPELQGVGAPQTIDQRNLYGVAARLFEDPGVADDQHTHTWRELARRTVLSAIGAHAGPVHLNLAFREPLVGTPQELPARSSYVLDRKLAAPRAQDVSWVNDQCRGARGVIVVGHGVRDPKVLSTFAERMGWPLIADPRSGCRKPGVQSAMLVAHADAILRTETSRRLQSEVVLRLGDPPASKVVTAWLAQLPATHIVVSPTVAVHDPERVVKRQILADIETFVSQIVSEPAPGEWGAAWQKASTCADQTLDQELDKPGALNEPRVARIVAEHLPVDSTLVVSSSMPIRDIEWFARTVVPDVVANRGANGIDGVVSTAVGVALGTDGPVAALVGDIAFLHDTNALLGLARRQIDLRVIVVDNDGGGIFAFLPQATQTESAVFEKLWGTPHGVDIAALAGAHGVPFIDCTTTNELVVALTKPGPMVIRIRTNRVANVEVHDALNQAVAESLRKGGV
jgi:2-succinyl-5-enolpyruvyl-6-hydroxy-3-cyclohexene-1-carboxylate synthase